MDNCKKCEQALASGNHFCAHCNSFVLNPALGKKAGLFKRWLAYNLDLVLMVFTLSISFWIAAIMGTTPFHALFGMKFIKSDGTKAGFGTILLREIIGKSISLLVFGLGFYWAIWDKDRQSWHDKIAGTLVIERT